MQGSHGKLDAPWIPPNLSDLDELVGFDFDRKIKSATLDILKDNLLTLVNSRRISSGSSDTAFEEKLTLFKSRYLALVVAQQD